VLYPAAGEDALDLLYKTLLFNPFFRITVDDCLNHKFFAKVRKTEKEQVAAKGFVFEFEKETLDKVKLRQLFIEQILYYKEQREAGNIK